MHTVGMDELLANLAAHPNIEVRVFNPFSAGRQTVATRKLLTTIPQCFRFLDPAQEGAGLPVMDEKGRATFPMTPPDYTKRMMRFVDEFGVNIVVHALTA